MTHLENLISMSGPRDNIFNMVLYHYQNKPVKVFQIGAIETLDNTLFKIGSGWSDIVFGKYIKSNGGHFTVADISLDHLANSKLIADTIGYSYNILHGDGSNFIDDSYDIYYLDGSINPVETENQFRKIIDTNKKQIHILIDDFSIKGTSIDLTKYNFKIYNIEKGLGVLYHG